MQTDILLEAGTNELEIVEFFIENLGRDNPTTNYYGVNVAKVLEIIKRPNVTELPGASHPSILGVFNLRSTIIPLVDLNGYGRNDRYCFGSGQECC